MGMGKWKIMRKETNLIKLVKKIVILIILVIIGLSICNKIDLKNIRNQIMMKIYKLEYSEYVKKYAKEYDVDKYLIFAIIKAESNFDQDAVSHREAKGLMQLMYSTAEEIAKKVNVDLNEENILKPDININLGTKYISMLIQKYGNINLALAAYNAGSGNVDGWIEKGTLKEDGSDIENIPFTETNNYVRKILRDYEIYKKLYEEK
jgi:soluble lytic murein transglycosylase